MHCHNLNMNFIRLQKKYFENYIDNNVIDTYIIGLQHCGQLYTDCFITPLNYVGFFEIYIICINKLN